MSKREFLTIEDSPADEPDGQATIPDEVVLASSQERAALFGLLVDRYQPSFLRGAERVVRDHGEAEDVVQEAFVKMYRYAKRFKKGEDRKFSSWAYKIVLNTAITHYHKVKKRDWLLPEDVDPTVGGAHVRLKEAVIGRETDEVVRSVLGMMPEDLGGLLRAYYLEDKSYKTIANERDMSIGALKMKLFRARKLFRKFIT